MFELRDRVATIANFNPRAESHGKEKEPAFDLLLTIKTGSDILDSFHPELKSMIFTKEDTSRFKRLSLITWNEEFESCDVTLSWGALEGNKIELFGVKINAIKIKPIEGGAIQLGLRAQGYASAETKGMLCDFILKEMDVDIQQTEPNQTEQGQEDLDLHGAEPEETEETESDESDGGEPLNEQETT